MGLLGGILGGGSSTRRSRGSEGSFLDEMGTVDIATVIVLAADAYFLYNHLDTFEQDQLLEFTTTPEILAVQFTSLMVVVYLVEAYADMK
jgi:hypothetical protein